MDIDLRQLSVFIVLFVTIGVRLVAHQQAGGLTRDQSDGLEREGGKAVATALRLFFLIGGFGGTLVWVFAPYLLPGNVALPTWVHWPAMLLACGGLILLVAVQIALGVHFSGTLHLRDDHPLVQSGPYARVRHPTYTSFLMLFIGLSVLIANVYVAAVLLGSQVWVLAWRLRDEEAQLAERFGDEWAEYRAATGALLPRSGRSAATPGA